MGTVIVGAILVVICAAIIVSMVKKKKSGKSIGCSCGCSGCANEGVCHPKNTDH